MGINCKLFGHKWNGCTCERCGTIRDEQHDWNGYKCSHCGKKRDLSKIHDQALLAEIAKNQSLSIDERCEAAENLTDQRALAEIAKFAIYKGLSADENIKVRLTAVEKITDIVLLSDIALSAKYLHSEDNVGRKAIERITDQSVLIDIANNVHYPLRARIIALVNIKDQNILHNFAINDINPDIRRVALKQSTDQTVLIAFVKNTDYSDTDRLEVLDRINDSNLRDEIRREIDEKNCEVGNHKWIHLTNCRKKCKICGTVWYDHALECTFSPIGDSGLPSEYRCRKCGYEGLEGGQGGATLQTGLVE